MNQPSLQKYKIGDLIDAPSVQTVIRLEQNDTSASDAIKSFVFTSDINTHLHVLFQSFMQPKGQGYFLQGDFGSGKSHFLAMLSAWFSDFSDTVALSSQHDGLQKFKELNRRILPVVISLVNFRSNTSLEHIITEAIESSLRLHNIDSAITARSQFLDHLKQILKNETLATEFADTISISSDSVYTWIDGHRIDAYNQGLIFLSSKGLNTSEQFSRERFETFENAINITLKSGFDGIIILIDELSEFFRSKPDSTSLNEDARTLQLLGELSQNYPLWIIAAVQESIERTGDVAQATFRKIKDRFPVKLHLSTLHIRDLISKRLVKFKPDSDVTIYRIYEEYCKHFPGFSATPTLFRSIYPVHPLTLSLLEGLGDLFSQHRGIVDFIHYQISGDSKRNIPGILDKTCTELVSPDTIYDHFASRIAEFSSFYIYPSQIVPHLDEIIDQIMDDVQDKILARKLIRILVLYAIHPTASTPTVKTLAELVCCMLSFQDPDANSQYVAEVLLDPIMEKSRFLVKKISSTGNPLDSVYSITTSEDQGRILRSRIDRVMSDILPGDSRVFLLPLSELPESYSWPGPSLWNRPVERSIVWRQSTRKASVFYLYSGNEFAIENQIRELLANAKIDFAVVISTGQISINCDNTLVWIIPAENTDNPILKEYFACRMIAGELRPANPSDIPLIPQLKDTIKKLEPAVHQYLLQQIFNGKFSDTSIEFESAAREIRRFDRIIETSGELILENRYPRFKEIASRSIPPSIRYYQRLFDEFIIPGVISMRDARIRGLSEPIETMAVPLGFVEVKSGNYLFAPNPVSNQFLGWFFSLLPASGQVAVSNLFMQLQTGPYGTPHDLACFLIASLAYCGLISLINKGRSVPLEYIKLMNVDQTESVAPGELINSADRETILNTCSFLYGSQAADTFGLKQQRDIWQAVLKFKNSGYNLISELNNKIQKLSGFSAFNSFNLEDITNQCTSITKVLDEIKTSYTAREGLERFVQTWRSSGLTSEAISQLKMMERFLDRNAERIVFINHYLNHNSVIQAATEDSDTAQIRDTVLLMLKQPDLLVITDEGEQLQAAFDSFRQSYSRKYSTDHALFHKSRKKTNISRHSLRALQTIRRLNAIVSLDCPSGTKQFFDEIDKPAPAVCNRNCSEELLRSPLCSCGYQCGTTGDKKPVIDIDNQIKRILHEYVNILQEPRVLEAVSVRAFAIRDVDRKAADQLKSLHTFLKNSPTAIITICDMLDDTTVSELDRAISGQAIIENRNLSTLKNELSGRRLTPLKVKEIVNSWLGNITNETILSIDDNSDSFNSNTSESLLWPSIHPCLFGNIVQEHQISKDYLLSLSTILEQQFPSKQLSLSFDRAVNSDLISFICKEPVHLTAIQSAWNILADRLINTPEPFSDDLFSNFIDSKEATGIKKRMLALKELCTNVTKDFPDRLRTRISAVLLYHDCWSSPRLKKSILYLLEKVSSSSSDWFQTLPVIPKTGITDPITVVLIDAVPVDVWLETLQANSLLFKGGNIQIRRLTGASLTIDSINELFGFSSEKDPTAQLSYHNINYVSITGNEERLWTDLIPLPLKDHPQLVRLSLFDQQAHSGTIHLPDMIELLKNILVKNISPLINLCRSEKRSLIITTDHGLSFSSKGLFHGNGGPYEQIIFSVYWPIH